jgi:superfamily II DNA or RNA helicase
MKLRSYQRQAVDEILAAFRENSSALIVIPTGGGKTIVVASVIAEHHRLCKGRAMVIAHREELIFQAAEKIKRVAGLNVDIEMAEMRAASGLLAKAPVIVSSVQTQIAGCNGDGRMSRFDPMEFSLLVTDEAHHAVSPSWRRVIAHYRANPDLKVLGVTATPDRADEAALGQVFDSVAFDYELPDAIHDGWLVPVMQRTVTVDGLDLSSVRTTAGDLNGADLARVMEYEAVLHEIAHPTFDLAGNRKTLIFAASVAHAERLCEILNRHRGGCARFVCGTTPKEERRQMLADYASGRFQFLCNVGVACLDSKTEILTTKGWVGHKEITPDHEVANWQNGRIWFAKPLAVEVRDRRPDERMVFLETKNRSVRVTDDHRMLYRTYRKGDFLEARAHELVDKVCGLPISGMAEPLALEPEQESQGVSPRRISSNTYHLRRAGMTPEEAKKEAIRRASQRASLRYALPSELTDRECEFIGFWLGDGTRQELQKGGVEYKLWQAESYRNLVAWIDKLIDDMGVDSRRHLKPPRRQGGSRVIEWSFPRGTGFGPQKRAGLYRLEPYLDKSGSKLLWALSVSQFAAVMRGFWMADGEHRDAKAPRMGRWRVCNTNRQLLDILQAVACCRGYRANITDGLSNTAKGHAPLWKLSVSRRNEHLMTKHRLKFEDSWRPETVWCVKSESGFIVTRRRGTVTVTGNTEGFDEPSIQVVVMARPTKSRALYAQMSGRSTRPLEELAHRLNDVDDAATRRAMIAASNKPHCEIVDFVGNSGRHKLITTADILGGKYDDAVVERARKKAEDAGCPVDMDQALQDSEWEIAEEKARARRAALRVKAKYTVNTVDPFDVLDLAPWREKGWDKDRQPTEKMLAMLGKAGVPTRDLSFTKAKQLIGEIIRRRDQKKCTFKQARILAKYGYRTDVDFHQARELIDEIAANGWRRVDHESEKRPVAVY